MDNFSCFGDSRTNNIFNLKKIDKENSQVGRWHETRNWVLHQAIRMLRGQMEELETKM